MNHSIRPRHFLRLFAGVCLLAVFSAQADVTIDKIRKLPPLPKVYSDEPSLEARVEWLKQRLTETSDAVEQYRYRRAMFEDYYFEHRTSDASVICRQNKPLRDDVIYREHCILATETAYDQYMPMLFALVREARLIPNPRAATQVLSDAAWRQSQAGDIAGAFESFEGALSIAPRDDVQLLGDLMMDTATSYIVNGDDAYIKKGIGLLNSAKQTMELALSNPNDSSDKNLLKSNISLAEFNIGIAYLLHLHDYQNAVLHFDEAVGQDSPIQEDGLVFAAMAAAELKQFDRAKALLVRADKKRASGTAGSDPVVQEYLVCYKQLTIRHWNPTQPVSACLNLKPETTTEVEFDVFKRLSDTNDASISLAGLKGLKDLFVKRLEPQLRRRGSSAASNTELKRLQLDSEFKGLVLKQQEELQHAKDAATSQRQNYFIALSLLLSMAVLLIASQWRAKKKLAEQYERLSVIDTLTKLGNRRCFEQNIDRELSKIHRLRRRNKEVALGLYLFDIDHFKTINDRFGHAAGDEVLVELGKRIKAATRETDLLVRWGGEEFLLIAQLENNAYCAELASRILEAVNGRPFSLSGHEPVRVTCTIGATNYPFLANDESIPWNSVVSIADMALYHGKASGRNKWIIVENKHLSTSTEMNDLLKMSLQQALEARIVTMTTA
jgi:two-component system cell cycle response regulator